MKKLFFFLVLAAAGALVYYFVLRSPESRMCARLNELCGDGNFSASCEKDLGELRKALGPDALERAAECVSDSDTCTEAATCMAAGMMRDAMEQFGKGIERALEQ